jgi:hypothetical protein
MPPHAKIRFMRSVLLCFRRSHFAGRSQLPVTGPFSVGACGCLPFVIEGLARLERFEEASALLPVAEHVVANGPLCAYSQHLFRTSAGIAAACARNGRARESTTRRQSTRRTRHRIGLRSQPHAPGTPRGCFRATCREIGECARIAVRSSGSLRVPGHCVARAAGSSPAGGHLNCAD